MQHNRKDQKKNAKGEVNVVRFADFRPNRTRQIWARKCCQREDPRVELVLWYWVRRGVHLPTNSTTWLSKSMARPAECLQVTPGMVEVNIDIEVAYVQQCYSEFWAEWAEELWLVKQKRLDDREENSSHELFGNSGDTHFEHCLQL